MKRIILTTFGSFGDIHPYIAIALELQSRGHDVAIATSELYRDKMTAAGVAFIPVRPNIAPPQEQGSEVIEQILNPRKGAKYLLDEMIFPHLRDGYEDLMLATAGADLLVTHPLSFAGPLIAAKTSIPWISSVLSPVSFFSAYDPPMPPFWQWTRHLQVLGPRFTTALFKRIMKMYANAPYDQFRDELGLPDCGNPVFAGQHSPTMVLALFSNLFAQPQPDWPPQTRVTGFPFYDGLREAPMPDALSAFLDSGPPPIIFTLGSSAVWMATDFYQESIAAARMLGRRAVLLIGDARNHPSESLPSEIIAVDYAPFATLLPRGCTIVHSGGVGSTAQGLRAGVPTLIVPFAFDQPDNAAHAARLGTSRTLSRKKYRAARVAKELDILLGTADYATRAKAVALQLRQENGAATASDLIETVLGVARAPQRGEELVHASSH